MQDNFWSETRKLFEKFKKRAKIKDLKYTAQISESQDDDKPVYMDLQMVKARLWLSL